MTTPYLVSYAVLWLLVVVLCVAVIALYQHFAQMYMTSREGRHAHGLAEGTRVVARTYNDRHGRPLQLPSPATPQVILFTDTTCPLCKKLLPELDSFAQRTRTSLALVCVGMQDDVARWAAPISSEEIIVVPDPKARISSEFRVAISPFLVAVDRSGTVRARGIVNDIEGLERAHEILSLQLEATNGEKRAVGAASAAT